MHVAVELLKTEKVDLVLFKKKNKDECFQVRLE